jgi:DnaJ-class molecular chaperone
MDNTKNYYGTLGVLPTAEPIVIRAAYRALAMKYHPDKWTGDKATAERRMREINQAYEILSDEQSRARYDRQKKTLMRPITLFGMQNRSAATTGGADPVSGRRNH